MGTPAADKGYPPVFYLPSSEANVWLLVRTKHYSDCRTKGNCTHYSLPIGGSKSEYAVWTYEKPYEAVANIKEHVAFYPHGSMQSKRLLSTFAPCSAVSAWSRSSCMNVPPSVRSKLETERESRCRGLHPNKTRPSSWKGSTHCSGATTRPQNDSGRPD